MSKTVINLIKEGDEVTVKIDGKFGEVVTLLSQALIDVADSEDGAKKIVANACTIILRQIFE